MTEPGSLGDFSVRAGVSPGAGGRPVRDGEPFRLLVIGDFSGRGTRGGSADLKARKPRRVDRDDLDDVLAGLGAELSIRPHAGAEPIALRPRSVDDLHPDELWNELDVFAELRALRRRLSNPDTYDAASAEIRGAGASSAPADRSRAAAEPAAVEGSLLDAAISETADQQAESSSIVDAVLRELVIPKLPDSAEQAQLIASVDGAAADEMRAILTDPGFRRLECAWRSTEFLIRRLETDARLQVWIYDATLEEIVRDVAANEDPRSTGLWRSLFEPDAAADGTVRWAAWTALDLSIGARSAQIGLLARFGRLALEAGAPFLAAARADLVGASSFGRTPDPSDWSNLDAEAAAAWRALRETPEARWLELVAPRVLLRAPYGRKTSPLERIDFEEVTPGAHENFVWGSGAIVSALVLGQSFTADGWSLTTRARWEVDRLPVCVVRDEDGDAFAQPCAETVLTERALDAMTQLGLTPLMSIRESDRVRIEDLKSIAGEPLAGGWAE